MKKTFIAIIALSGVAFAQNEEGSARFTDMQLYPRPAGAYYSGSYELMFTLTEAYDMSSTTVLAGYCAPKNYTEARTGNGIVLEGSTLKIGLGNFNDVTFDIFGRNVFGDNFSFTMSAVDGEYVAFSGIEKGVFYTLSVEGNDGYMTATLSWDGGSVTSGPYDGRMNNPSGNNGGMFSHINPDMYDPNLEKPAPSAPEPATATLSLLALAGLAARRRRK